MTTAEAQKQLINIVKSVTQENESYQINDERGSAILISQNAYESLEETIELLSIPNRPVRNIISNLKCLHHKQYKKYNLFLMSHSFSSELN